MSLSGKHGDATVVVDQGMAYAENLEEIREAGHHYLVAGRQPERNAWLAEFEYEAGWDEVVRELSPLNPEQKKSVVRIKRCAKGNEVYILCLSEGRRAKDRAIREKQEERLQQDLEALGTRIGKGHLKDAAKTYEAIGWLKERYPRVACYYQMEYDTNDKRLAWRQDGEKKAVAESWTAVMCLRPIARI